MLRSINLRAGVGPTGGAGFGDTDADVEADMEFPPGACG